MAAPRIAPAGLLYCDILDFLETCRLEGAPQTTTKVDHCFWLCQETAPAIFRASGLEVVTMNATEPGIVAYLLRRGKSSPPEAALGLPLNVMLRRLREIDADWRNAGRTPLDMRDRVHRFLYRLKCAVARSMRSWSRKGTEEPRQIRTIPEYALEETRTIGDALVGFHAGLD